MEPEKKGIEQLQKVIFLILAMADSVDYIGHHTELGVARFAKLTDCFDELMAMGSFNFAEMKAEFADLDAEEKTKLMVAAKEKFDLIDDVLEAKIEQGIDLFLEGYALITKIGVFAKTLKA